jgi:hypothetical protein
MRDNKFGYTVFIPYSYRIHYVSTAVAHRRGDFKLTRIKTKIKTNSLRSNDIWQEFSPNGIGWSREVDDHIFG